MSLDRQVSGRFFVHCHYHSMRNTTSEEYSDVHDSLKVAVRVAGILYYLLDDFNHKHEHTVVAGSNQLQYSSTHRVAREGRGTWHYIQEKV